MDFKRNNIYLYIIYIHNIYIYPFILYYISDFIWCSCDQSGRASAGRGRPLGLLAIYLGRGEARGAGRAEPGADSLMSPKFISSLV